MYICFKIVAGAGEIGPEKGLREGGGDMCLICLASVDEGGTRADEVLQCPTTDIYVPLAGKLSKPAQGSSPLQS